MNQGQFAQVPCVRCGTVVWISPAAGMGYCPKCQTPNQLPPGGAQAAGPPMGGYGQPGAPQMGAPGAPQMGGAPGGPPMGGYGQPGAPGAPQMGGYGQPGAPGAPPMGAPGAPP